MKNGDKDALKFQYCLHAPSGQKCKYGFIDSKPISNTIL